MRCCGAGCRAPGKGWERKGRERIERPNGLADRAASAAAIRPGSARTSSAIANMADRSLNWIGNAWERRLDSADKFARVATAAANRLPVILRGERQPTNRLIRFGWVDGRRRSTGRLRARGRTGNFEPSATLYLRCVLRHGKSQLPGAPGRLGSPASYLIARIIFFRRPGAHRGGRRKHWRLRHSRKWTRG
jgi:hypothetical protein